MPDLSRAEERITAIAVELLLRRGCAEAPDAARNLREAGLTSLDMVNLMLGVEAEFDIEIPQSAMKPENFDTIAALGALIAAIAGPLTSAA